MKALIVSLAAIHAETFANEYIELLANNYASKSGMCGVSHDGQNLYVAQAPQGWQLAEHIELNTQYDSDGTLNLETLELQIGAHLAQDNHIVLVGEHKVFDALFKRPLWQLWCFNFEDEPSAEIAYKKVFGESATLDGRKSMSDLRAQVRTEIKSMIGN